MAARRRRRTSVLQTRFFYVSSIFAVSLGTAFLMWRFQSVRWVTAAFGLAWVVLVTAFAWEVVTRAETLDELVRSRTDALEESNRNLAALLEQLNAFHAISYEINQRIELEQIARTFVDRACRMLPGIESAWLWLDPAVLCERQEPQRAEGEPVSFEVAAQAGQSFGMPQELSPLRLDNPLVARCSDGRSVSVDQNLQSKARARGWRWLEGSRAASFVGFPLQLGGAMLGVLGVFSREAVSAEFISQFHQTVNQLAAVIEKARLLRETARRAEELAAANEELKQLDVMKDWFVSSVSHELRTPLTNIRSFGEILENYEDLQPAERKEFASIIRAESERLSGMISDVLDLAKIERGEVQLTPAPFDLPALVGRCCKLFSQEAEERHIAFAQVVPPDGPQPFADEQGVARVLNNLLANAFKFTPDGGRIQVTVEPPDGAPAEGGAQFLTVMVSDTGVGIALSDQPKVFERFAQVGRSLSGKPPGTGIGLAICREIVERSGGEMWVQSQPNEGSTFGFTLPLGLPTHV
jgi:signal transduction histidine kinase